MIRHVVPLILFAMLAACPNFAQIPPPVPPQPPPRDQDGTLTNSLDVQIAYSSGRHVDQYIDVRLESTGGGMVAEQFTDGEGKVKFSALRPGEYIIRVRGAKIIETISGTVRILPTDRSLYEYIEVKPIDTADSPDSPPAPVAAAQLKIPKKALKEFEDGGLAASAGDREKAMQHFRKAVELYPKFPMAHNNLAALYMQAKDYVHTREELNKALDADPDLAITMVNMAKLDLMEQKYPSAITMLEKALAKEPANTEFLYRMCQAQFLSGKYDQTVLYAHKVVAVPHQEFEMAHILAGRALEAQNHPDQAKVEYETLLKESQTTPPAAEARKALVRLNGTPQEQ